MARPKQIDDDQLLDALKGAFLELGPAASTQELAKRAGVSEGTLFKRFGTKKKIFMEAMRLPVLEERAWFLGMIDDAGREPLEESLVRYATELRAFFDEIMPLINVITAGGKLSTHELSCALGDTETPPPELTITRFSQYFSQEMELGRVKRVDPRAVASMFVGALSHDFHLRLHFPTHDFGDKDAFCRRIARTLVELVATESTGTIRSIGAATA